MLQRAAELAVSNLRLKRGVMPCFRCISGVLGSLSENFRLVSGQLPDFNVQCSRARLAKFANAVTAIATLKQTKIIAGHQMGLYEAS